MNYNRISLLNLRAKRKSLLYDINEQLDFLTMAGNDLDMAYAMNRLFDLEVKMAKVEKKIKEEE